VSTGRSIHATLRLAQSWGGESVELTSLSAMAVLDSRREKGAFGRDCEIGLWQRMSQGGNGLGSTCYVLVLPGCPPRSIVSRKPMTGSSADRAAVRAVLERRGLKETPDPAIDAVVLVGKQPVVAVLDWAGPYALEWGRDKCRPHSRQSRCV
jgi:hypothetical protein